MTCMLVPLSRTLLLFQIALDQGALVRGVPLLKGYCCAVLLLCMLMLSFTGREVSEATEVLAEPGPGV